MCDEYNKNLLTRQKYEACKKNDDKNKNNE